MPHNIEASLRLFCPSTVQTVVSYRCRLFLGLSADDFHIRWSWYAFVAEFHYRTVLHTVSHGHSLDDDAITCYDNRSIIDIDTLAIETNISVFELSALLLELELEDYVISKPGKVYKAL